jgi:hypothetical protein
MVTKVFAQMKVAAMLVAGGIGLSACATQDYVDHRIAEVNEHITVVETKANDAEQKADAAMAAAQAAQALATQVGQKVDALSVRVDALQQAPPPAPMPRTPRG